MSDQPEVVVIGAGQAGLAVSRELGDAGVSHVVLERGRVGQTWSGRWESFCLVTPNWTMQLPGQPYDGEDPDGFDLRDEIVGFLERYALKNEAPVQEGIEVSALDPLPRGAFGSRPPPTRSRRRRLSSPRAPISAPTDRPEPTRSRPTCSRSTFRATPPRARSPKGRYS